MTGKTDILLIATSLLLLTACSSRTTTISVPISDPELGETWIRPADGMVMVYVPGGAFQMGGDPGDALDDNELPQHPVTLDGFWIDQTEVTNAQFVTFLNNHGNVNEEGLCCPVLLSEYLMIRRHMGEYQLTNSIYADHPVVEVSWTAADLYCRWVGGRLPTEAEWEYAARGPQGHIYPWGNDAPDCSRANFTHFENCNACATAPPYSCAAAVGSYPAGASWCGALDMAGNVWEFVADWYSDYPSEAQINPVVSARPTAKVGGPPPTRVLRGGSWESYRAGIRAERRIDPYDKSSSSESDLNLLGSVGFRCVVP